MQEINALCVWHVSRIWLIHQTLQEPLGFVQPAGRVSWSRGPQSLSASGDLLPLSLICLKIWTITVKTLMMLCWRGNFVFRCRRVLQSLREADFFNHRLASYVMVSLSLSFPVAYSLSCCLFHVHYLFMMAGRVHWFHIHLLECWAFLYSIFSLHLLNLVVKLVITGKLGWAKERLKSRP